MLSSWWDCSICWGCLLDIDLLLTCLNSFLGHWCSSSWEGHSPQNRNQGKAGKNVQDNPWCNFRLWLQNSLWWWQDNWFWHDLWFPGLCKEKRTKAQACQGMLFSGILKAGFARVKTQVLWKYSCLRAPKIAHVNFCICVVGQVWFYSVLLGNWEGKTDNTRGV